MDKVAEYLSKYKFDILFIVSIALIALFLSKNFSLLHIQGNSMYPTYNNKETLIIKKNSTFENNDLAVFTSPSDWNTESKKFIKRIIASEGDTLSIEGNSMKVNGEEIANIEDKRCRLDDFEITIEDESYFMVGDNYSSSNDSLTQLCNGNEHFLVGVDNMLFSGREIFVIGGF